MSVQPTPETAIEQVLQIRVRVARTWEATCEAAWVAALIDRADLTADAGANPSAKTASAIAMVRHMINVEYKALLNARTAVERTERDLQASSQALGETELIAFTPASNDEIKRYAIQLCLEDIELDPETAVAIARAAERLRADDHAKRYSNLTN